MWPTIYTVATQATIANDVTTNATMYPVWVTANSGNLPLYVSSTQMSWNPSTGVFIAPTHRATTAFDFGGSGTITSALGGAGLQLNSVSQSMGFYGGNGMAQAAFPSTGVLSWNNNASSWTAANGDIFVSRIASGVLGIGVAAAGVTGTIRAGAIGLEKDGAAATVGNATLVAGTVTVSTTAVGASDVVLLTRKTSGGTIGTAITYTINAGVSFTVTSDSVLDTSVFSWTIVQAH